MILGWYGVVLNQLSLDLSKRLGVYVGGVFALVSVLFGKLVYGEAVSLTALIGLAIVLGGSLAIQLGG